MKWTNTNGSIDLFKQMIVACMFYDLTFLSILFSFECTYIQNNRNCPVTIAERPHLFPCRTQTLSSPAPMVVGCTSRESRTSPGNLILYYFFLFHSSSVVELSAVNRSVVGSSPTCGAIFLFIIHNNPGPLVKRLRHRPFTAVTRVRIP